MLSAAERRNLFDETPWWAWPILWWSLARLEVWLEAFRAECGPCEVMITVNAYGLIKVAMIGDRRDRQDWRARLTKPAAWALSRALRSERVTSQPVQLFSCPFARRASAAHSRALTLSLSKREGASLALEPVSLAPT